VSAPPFTGDHNVSSFAPGRAFPSAYIVTLGTAGAGRAPLTFRRTKTAGLLQIASSGLNSLEPLGSHGVHADLSVFGAFGRGLMREAMKSVRPKVARAAPLMAVSAPLLLLFQRSSRLEFSNHDRIQSPLR
jgi:hypothetical protein